MKKATVFVSNLPRKFSERKLSRLPLIIVALLAGAVGTYAIVHSFAAATPYSANEGFESGTLSGWNIAGVGDAVPTVVSDIVRSGTKSARFVLTGNQGRSELILGGDGSASTAGTYSFTEGDDYYYAFSIYIVSMTYGQPGGHNVIFQLKGDDQQSPSLALQLWNSPGAASDGSPGGKGLWYSGPALGSDRFLSPLSEQQWHDIVVHFKVSNQGAGADQIYLDGKLLRSDSNVNTMQSDTSSTYIKDGIYRNGDTVVGTSDIRIDDAKLGTTYASVAEPSNSPPADTTAPTISLTAPANGATVSGSSVAVSANASDDVGVAGVQFKLDGNNLGSEDTSSPYGLAWNATTATNGAHTLTAVARDAAGNTKTASPVSVTVNNSVPDTTPPDTSIVTQPNGSTASTNASFSFTSTESNSTFECKLDSGAYSACTSPKAYTNISVGSHNFSVRAIDGSGNVDASPATYSWTVTPPPDTTAPTVSFTSPTNGSTVSGTVTATAAASDDTGITKVELSLDGTLKMTDTTSPYNYSFDSKTLANGNHTITAKAYDAAGNTTPTTITVNVQNTDTTPPSAPGNVHATAAGPTTVNLTWTASSDNGGATGAGIAKYNVLRNGIVIAQPTTPGYTDTTAVANTSYTYVIQAVDSAGNVSANSTAASVTTPSTGGSQSNNLIFSDDFESGNFNKWYVQALPGRVTNPSGGAAQGSKYAHFEVDQGDVEPDTGSSRAELVGPTFDEGQDLYFNDAIRIPNGITVSGNWELITQLHETNWGGSPGIAVFLDRTPQLNLRNGAGSPNFWNSATLQTNRWYDLVYHVKLSQDPSVGYVQVWLDGVPQTLLNGQTTMYGKTIQTDQTYLKIGIYRSSTSTGTSLIDHDNISVGTTYDSVTGGGSSPSPDTTPPTTPTSLAATAASTSQVDLTWHASTDTGGSGLAGYNLYRNGTKLNTSLITGTSYGDSGLNSGATYSYKLEAVDGAGNKSPQTATVSATTPATLRGDITGPNGAPDGKIDLYDLSYAIRNYGTNNPTADITGKNGTPDGTVDIYDLSYIIRNYGG